MSDAGGGPPLIALPERLDRRMRLGPFPSSRDALKFLGYAATGALVSPFSSPWLWVPILLGGFALSVWRPEGRAVDETVVLFLVWRLRSRRTGVAMKRDRPRPLVRQALLQVGTHRHVAILRTGGSPVAYLPPDELAHRFESYRELLRSTESGFAFLATTIPIRASIVRPSPAGPVLEDSPARVGYSELVELLCKRRFVRRVYWIVGSAAGDTDSIGRLEGRVSGLVERLSALGLRPTRLRDRALSDAAKRFGWAAEVTGS